MPTAPDQAVPATLPTAPNATAERRRMGSREVWLQGPATASARDTLLLLHGWPDDLHLWDGLVAALAPRHRCVRFTLPGFAQDDGPLAPSLAEVTALLAQVAREAGGGQPITLVLHDWGCFFGYHFAQQHPELVARIVGLDIGDSGSRAHRAGLNAKAKFGILAYQLWLALAWRLGGPLGDRIARRGARWTRTPRPLHQVHARMGYPYWIAWFGTHGSYRAARPLPVPAVPMFYGWGKRKLFMFHSGEWVQRLAAQPGNQAKAYRAGHWLMLDAAAELQADVAAWLDATAAPSPAAAAPVTT